VLGKIGGSSDQVCKHGQELDITHEQTRGSGESGDWTRELKRKGTSHPRLPWRQERSSKSLGYESDVGADEINNILYMLSSVLPDVTDK
jgi:hypothetical protein